ncbi:MAG: glycoside hydrolase family 3 protein [DPANN group archaeon]|nr:glycoside hydrolase family 3 protein [DPANN group archaeon]
MKQLRITFLLAILVAGLLAANLYNEFYKANAKPPENIVVAGKFVDLSSMTLRQKIAQMMIVYGNPDDKALYQQMNIGGVFLTAMDTPEAFNQTTNLFQRDTKIPFFIAADVEGCINPFENFIKFPALHEIETDEDAFTIGKAEGQLMKELGMNMNFAPVVDTKDTIWNCRSFSGTSDEISGKAESYVRGLQSQNVIATPKHYPGKTLSVRDPHRLLTYAVIDSSDTKPFAKSAEAGAGAVMISHVIGSGAVDTEGKPAVTSKKAVTTLKKNFGGLVITDDINMLGLIRYYGWSDNRYIDLFAAGNDVVLDVASSPDKINHIIDVVEKAVWDGKIPASQIDNSVRKILKAKGFTPI